MSLKLTVRLRPPRALDVAARSLPMSNPESVSTECRASARCIEALAPGLDTRGPVIPSGLREPLPAAGLQLWALPDVPEVGPGDDLATLALAALRRAGLRLADGDVLVFAQKIVSKSERRRIDLRTVVPGAEAQRLAAIAGKDARVVELILRESDTVLRCVPGVIVVRHRRGWVLANAGIDQSNVGAAGHALLLPEDPDHSAARLRAAIAAATGVAPGVVVSDSFGRAWRRGTTGIALGAAGLPALLDQRGRADRDGRVLQTTEVGHADELAAAASLLMGQADESRPIVLLRGLLPVARERAAAALLRPLAEDLFT